METSMFQKNLQCKVKRFFVEYAGNIELVPFEMGPADNTNQLPKIKRHKF
jgi:hypothetical protein